MLKPESIRGRNPLFAFPSWPRIGALAAVGLALLFGALALTGDAPIEKLRAAAPQALSTLLGVFAGAVLAFVLNREATRTAARREHISAVNRALAVMGLQYNTVLALRDEALSPYRDHPYRHIAMPPVADPEVSDLRVNWHALEFLLETEDRDLVLRIGVEDQNFRAAISALRTRCDFLVREFHPIQSQLMGSASAEVDCRVLEVQAGPMMMIKLRGYTDNVYHHVDGASAMLPKLAAELRSATEKLYPNAPLVSFKVSGQDQARGRPVSPAGAGERTDGSSGG